MEWKRPTGHFSPLNSTFLHCTSKFMPRKGSCKKISNEIKDLELTLQKIRAQKTF